MQMDDFKKHYDGRGTEDNDECFCLKVRIKNANV
jgi:hypothetical protein